MPWFYLVIAGLLEIGWAVGLKTTHGFTRLVPTVFTLISMVASLGFLALALRHLPIGLAYAVWTGIGVVGTVLIGMFAFGEPRDLARVICLCLILAGIAGLKFLHAH